MRKSLLTFFAALLCAASMWATPEVAINGKLPGAFSVSSTKVVYFSQGNLQYQASSNTWRFATNQYDFIGGAAGNNTAAANRATQTAWIDLFGWATSGNSASGTEYQPYASSSNKANYGSSVTSGEWTAANSDWGVVNSASLGSGWRTLTKDEWNYLFNTRGTLGTVNNTSNARYAQAQINTDGTSVNGMILFPDNFDGTKTYSGVSWGTINGTSAFATTCTTAGWAALENAGCVFLPAGGGRNNSTVDNPGLYGYYWSSTAYNTDNAYRLRFYSGSLTTQHNGPRSAGLSVRLASEVAPPTMEETPLTFEAEVAGAVVTYTIESGTLPTVEYKLNNGAWTTYSSPITLTNVGDKVSFRGNNATYRNSSGKNANFQCSQYCYIYGNIMSLVDATNYATNTTLTADYTFQKLFYDNMRIKNHASKALVLPATTLTHACYAYMFQVCYGLTSAPALPATTLTPFCYSSMFSLCCYLTSAPELPATTLAEYCYQNMFDRCINLVNAPALPATTLAPSCYRSMFSGCSKLTSAPALPATTLASGCYNYMFDGCSKLTTAPELPATTLDRYCYYGMFYRCTSLTTAPLLRATALTENCYSSMFYKCTNLSSVTCWATSRENANATTDWLTDVKSSGTFYAPAEGVLKDDARGVSAIPEGWTIKTIPAYSVSLASGTASASDWSFSPTSSLYGLTVAINNNGTRTVENVTVSRDITSTVEINSSNYSTAISSFNNTARSKLKFTSNVTNTLTITRDEAEIDLNGFTAGSIMTPNNEYGYPLTFKNGTLSGVDGAGGWGDWFSGTLIFENVTMTNSLWSDGHDVIIKSGTYQTINNYKKGDSPGTVTIYDGKIYAFNNAQSDAATMGATSGIYTLYGGKYHFDPRTITDYSVIIPSGYAVQSNTDSDSGTYPWKVVNTDPTKAVEFENLHLTQVTEDHQWTFTMPPYDVKVEVQYTDFQGHGTESDPYLISSTADWNQLATNVVGGKTYAGKFFRQTADISVTTMAGSFLDEDNFKTFSGIYDGNGRTLNVTYSGLGYSASPFVYITDATIKNLHITGSVSTTGHRPASITSFVSGNSTITNCWSEVAISSSKSNYWVDGGGLVARVNSSATLTMSGCLFTGSITYSDPDAYEGGGMVGWTQSGSSVTLNDCVFAPSSFTITKYKDHRMFVGGKVSGTLNNCYYNDVANASSLTKQGKLMRTITAGTGTTVANAGSATTYNVSGITSYGTGIKYNDVLYAGNGDAISLNLTHGEGEEGYLFGYYSATNGTITGNTNPYTLTMTNANTALSAEWLTPSEGPLTFEAMEDGVEVRYSISYNYSNNLPAIEYSINGGDWTATTTSADNIIVLEHVGDKVSFRGNNATYYVSWRGANLYCSKDCYIYGNIMSLVSSMGYATATSLTADYTFYQLFKDNTHIKNHPDYDLVLPASSLSPYCYYDMFSGCTGLTTAPALPATTMKTRCYQAMFQGCSGLTSAPELPATTLASACYIDMFGGCTGLTSAPTLPATTVVDQCYYRMFSGCSHLTSAPALPATIMEENCYFAMFANCTDLTSAPALPATTLAPRCYQSMFQGCTGITSAPALPATTLANNCYYSMFSGCTGLGSIPELPATTLATYCYGSMFSGCTGLTNILENLLPNTTLASSCYYGMFSGCTGLTSIPENLLPATTMVNWCYYNMFSGCTGLTSIPANLLPATTLADQCYTNMFSGCTGLTHIPANLLPATELVYYNYSYMFSGCTGLTSIPEDLLPATTLANGCYSGMFNNCSGLTSIPENLLHATTLADYCYNSMFNGCTNLSSVTCWAKTRENTNSTTNWLNNVAPTGTFYAPIDNVFASDERGASGIPEGWEYKLIPASLVSAPTAVDDFAYDGSAHALLNSAGTAEGGTMNYSLDGSSWSEDIPTAINAGDYTVYYMVAGDESHSDYTPTENSVAVSITPAPLTITADNKEIIYNEAAPNYTATYDGFVGGEDASVLSGTLALTCDYSAGDALGDYTITPSGLSSDNYAITYETGTLSVVSPDAITLPDNEDKTALLTALNGSTLDITVGRTIVAGPYNTLCLPFSLSAEEIAAGPLAGSILKDYNDADVSGTGAERDLNIYLSDLTEIEAGKPFLIKTESNIVNPTFTSVTISYTAAMGSMVEREHVDFQGILAPYDLAAYSNSSPDYLGIGMDGRLYWADASLSTAPMRGFRAFFHVKDAGAANSPVRRGMHAQFVEYSPKTPTGVETVTGDGLQVTGVQKIIRNGHVIIIRNGVEYTADGIIVNK